MNSGKFCVHRWQQQFVSFSHLPSLIFQTYLITFGNQSGKKRVTRMQAQLVNTASCFLLPTSFFYLLLPSFVESLLEDRDGYLCHNEYGRRMLFESRAGKVSHSCRSRSGEYLFWRFLSAPFSMFLLFEFLFLRLFWKKCLFCGGSAHSGWL